MAVFLPGGGPGQALPPVESWVPCGPNHGYIGTFVARLININNNPVAGLQFEVNEGPNNRFNLPNGVAIGPFDPDTTDEEFHVNFGRSYWSLIGFKDVTGVPAPFIVQSTPLGAWIGESIRATWVRDGQVPDPRVEMVFPSPTTTGAPLPEYNFSFIPGAPGAALPNAEYNNTVFSVLEFDSQIQNGLFFLAGRVLAAQFLVLIPNVNATRYFACFHIPLVFGL